MQIQKASHHESEEQDEIEDSLCVSTAPRRQRIDNWCPDPCPAALASHTPPLLIAVPCLKEPKAECL